MPILDTPQSAEEFRQAGFTERQSSLLAHKLEEAVQKNNEDLRQFIGKALGDLETRMVARMEIGFQSLRAEFHSQLRDQLLKMFAIQIAILSLAVAVIKLFPNAF
jgi:hypothetical protein